MPLTKIPTMGFTGIVRLVAYGRKSPKEPLLCRSNFTGDVGPNCMSI